jgi:thioredoxin 1
MRNTFFDRTRSQANAQSKAFLPILLTAICLALTLLSAIIDKWVYPFGSEMLSPALAQIAEENAGELKVGKVNVDDEMELAMQFGVTSIPLLVVMKGGKVVNKSLGYIPKDKIEALFK